jgi:nucleoside-diphosphate-sugar epimerase
VDVHAKPDLIYSLGKQHCEDVVRSMHLVYGMPYTTLRLFNVFGSGADDTRTFPPLIPYLIRELEAGRIPTLHSDGLQRRDYVYIADIVTLIVSLIRNPPLNTELNVCSGTAHSVREIVAMIQNCIPSNIEPFYRDPILLWDKADILWKGAYVFSHDRMKEEVNKTCIGDPIKTSSLTGWKATTSMQDGIREMILLRNRQ